MNTQTPTTFKRIRTLFKKFSATLFIALTLFSPAAFVGVGATTVLLAHPQPVYAGVPTLVDFSVPDALKLVLDFVKEGLIGAAKVGIKNALRSFLEKIAYDTAVWIGSGDENQKPLLFTKDAGTYLQEAGDSALGEVLNTMASENGFLNLNLCDLPTIESLKFQLILPQLLAAEPPEPDCSFSEIRQSLSDYATNLQEQAQAFMDDPRSLVDFSASLDSGSNALSSLMDAVDTAIGAKTEAERKAEIERSKSDFVDKSADISGYIQTPASVIGYQLQATINTSTQGETIQQDNIIADALGVFVNTLSSKLLERATSGLLSFFTESDISSSISGNASTAGTAGIKGAQEQFASFRTPSFTTGGTIDILTQFASCPEQGADVVNCVVDENFRLAIDEGLTVQEAINQGILDGTTAFGFDETGGQITDPSSGISLRNMKILKQYSVIPVGWVLAAEYNQDFDGSSLTLQQVIDAFSQCDEADYSPYCGLVDPDWVLKAPDVFCKVQGYGENIANKTFVDTDGNDYTPDQQLVSRLSSCLDSQSCLSEDDNGVCQAYGYCTAQRDIYRFEGDSCPSYQASCELFTDSEDAEVAYLKNTLNYNDCSTDNAGCQWYCTQYNEVDDAFQCAGEGLIYSSCETDGGCSCTVDAESCTILDGGYKCTTDGGSICTLGTETDATSGIDSAISFDDDVSSCDATQAGCSEFVSVNGGANLLFNPSFENFNSYQTVGEDALNELGDVADSAAATPYDDTFGFYGEGGDGEPCSASGVDDCYGWEFLAGATGRAISNSIYGSVAMQMSDTGTGSGYVSAKFETGQELENRSFVLSYNYINPSSSSCTGQLWIRPDGATSPAAVDVTYETGSSYTQVVSDPITFDDGVTTTAVRIGITQPVGCAIAIDGVKLEENTGNSGYTEYAEEPIYVNLSLAASCTAEEVGCDMYTPVTGGSRLDIPGIITNPLSDVCGNGDDFSNPACSQCEEQYVGCESYIPQEHPYSVPIKDVSGFDDPLDTSASFTTLANAVATRTGYYCEGTETSCSPEREALQCGSGVSCLPEISIVPTTGTSCSASNVGCEEYVNLDEQAAGGEGLEYYTYLRQCVQPTQDQIDAEEVRTYYTFEGSDVSGYQIRSWYLKASEDTDANGDSAPCTNLDVYGDSAQTVSAECIDTTIGAQSCDSSEVGVDPDCTEYYDDAGNVYYRLASATITAADSCQPLRNSVDQRIYYTIPDESTSCPASANLCTEYKGSKGNSAQTIVDENFDVGTWTGGESSSTVITANTGLSMALGTGTTNANTQASTDVSGVLDTTSSYIVTFWAKADADGALIYPYFASASTGTTSYVEDAGVSLNTEWRAYTAGPFVYDEELANDEVFGFEYPSTSGAIVYIDNVKVSESSSYYLLRGTSDLCPGYEGCQEYTNVDEETNYLKSFTNLCNESVVGCEALIDTRNSDTPFFQNYNADNEYTEDDVAVQEDAVVTYAVTDSVLCGSDSAGCSHLGQPTLDVSGDPSSFTDVYFLNDPDEYDTTLCQEQQLQCSEFTTGDGAVVYFKDPGDKVCSYDSTVGQWLTPDGDACPLQNENGNAAPSQPKGAICNGGLRAGNLCSADSDCPSATGDANIYRCDSDIDQDSGWVGSCNQQYTGCTQYVDPEPTNEITNGDFETDIETNDDITAGTPDGIPDDWNMNDSEITAYYANEVSEEGALPTGSLAGCSVIASDTTKSFDRATSLKLQASTAADALCMVQSGDVVTVDENAEYTLSGNVYLENASDRFGIGLLFYDADGSELYFKDAAHTTGLDMEDIAIAAFAGGSRTSAVTSTPLPTGEWLRFHGTIGPNLTRTFPEGTYYVRIVLEVRETTSSSSVYFDNVVFGKNGTYTYINSTVDGATESDENTCAGTIDEGSGCVAFRDTTSDSLTYLGSINDETAVNNGFIASSCTFNAGVPGTDCNALPDAADANSVIQVRNDRECSEWLTCTDSRPNYDDAGNLVSTTCFQIGSCIKRNEDTGVCTEYAPSVSSSALGYDDDITAVSQPGNTNELLDIQNNSGYVDVGVEWAGICSSNVCLGGANAGQACSSDTECEDANIEYGYYPEDWMTQRGLGGSESTTDIVKDGGFESVYCSGNSEYDLTAIGFSASQAQAVENTRDNALSCTSDSQCRTVDTESKVKSTLQEIESTANIDYIDYSAGWCENVSDSGSWTGATGGVWSTTSGATATIIDYDPTVDSVTSEDGVGAANLDLNNVMHVAPSDGDDGGIALNLSSDAIIQDQEYTISFDAQYIGTADVASDFIQVGLQHGFSSANTDFFEVGIPMADVVFLVDASTTMGPYITNVANATSSLVTSLEDAGIDYQTAIITTGGSRTARPLDFADYTGGAATDYGATSGITTDFTDSASTFSAAMSAIASSRDTGNVFNYEALKNIADNEFDIGTGTDYSLNFRPGAVRFVVLLTDMPPEAGDDYITGNSSSSWDEDDETDFVTTLGVPYVLYGITTSSAASAYDTLISNLGGGSAYSITDTSYSTLLTAISESMADRVSSFSFDSTYHRYTLGPLTIENKEDQNDETTLFIRQTTGASNLPFVIDNVSLLPSLEVNKENNPDTDDSTWLISRDCRGYPAQDSLFCNYTDTNGAIYTGWKGYCMQHDDYDNNKCVAWWPIDIIAGEPDSTARTKVQYNGRYPAYQCLVAKGVQDLNVCENDGGEGGKLCSSDADCGTGGTCVESYNTKATAPLHVGSGSEKNDPDNVYSNVSTSLDYSFRGTGYDTLSDGYKIVPRHVKLETGGVGSTDGEGVMVVMPASAVEQAITPADIADLKIEFTGLDLDGDSGQEFPSEGQVWSIATQYDPVSGDATLDSGAGDTCRDVDFIEDGNSTDIGFIWSVVGTKSDYVDGDKNPDNPYCGGGGGPDVFEALEDRSDDQCNGGGGGCSFSDGDTNEWEADVDDNEDVDNQSDDYDSYAWTADHGINDTQAKDAYGTDNKTYFKPDTNVIAVYLDFDDNGTLLNTRYFLWSAANSDQAKINLQLDWMLQETCVATVQTVDESADTTAWMSRVTSTSDYSIPTLDYTYDTPNSPYGSVASLNGTPDSSDWDGTSDDAETLFTEGDTALKIANDATSNGGSPYACVGQCTTSFCTGDGTTSCSSNADCSSNGFCTGVSTTAGRFAGEEGIQDTDNQGNSVDNYNDQVYTAALEAREKLKLVFADLKSEAYIRLEDEDFYTAASGTSESAKWEALWKSSSTSTNDIYYNMTVCSGTDQDDDDYCAIRPTVDNILLNNNSSGDLEDVQSGETISLSFDSHVDADQQPLQTIRIVWDGTTTDQDFNNETIGVTDPWEAASTVGHSYTHAYTCDPTNRSVWDGSSCVYKVKIQIQDAWDFCSGTIETGTTRGISSSCTSYDEYDGLIYVAP